MTRKPVVLRQRASEDIDAALGYYLDEAGSETAIEFVHRLETVVANISKHPELGSPRYGHELQVPGLRHIAMKNFPYVVFYIERELFIEVERVLHSRMDIPSWLDDTE